MEAYGQISCVPEIAHSSDWRAVRSEAERAIDAALNGRTPESMLADETWRAISRKAGTPIMLGSGWGALENLRRSRNGQPALSEVYDFSQASLTDEQTDWLLLLTNGQFAEKPVQDAPASFMGDAAWLPLMEKADGWYACLQRGVTRYAQGDLDGAWEEFVHYLSAAAQWLGHAQSCTAVASKKRSESCRGMDSWRAEDFCRGIGVWLTNAALS